MSREAGYVRRFSFGPLERRGVVGGLRMGQVAMLAGGALGALAAFKISPSAAGLVAGLGLISACSCGALLPLWGRPAVEWAPVLLAHAIGPIRYRSSQPIDGVTAGIDGSGERRRLGLPSQLSGCAILAFPVLDGREVGVLRDRASGTLTAAMAVRVRSFGLLSEAEQERRLERWGQALASLARAGGVVRRVQILERSVPSDGDAMQGYLAEARDRSVPADGVPLRSYEALIDGAGFVTQDHELFIVVQVNERRAAARAHRADAAAAACTTLVRELETFASRFDPADVVVEGVLSPRMLARAIRLAFDPYGRERLNRLAAADPLNAGVDPQMFGPTASETSWDRYRSDSAVHRTYWIAQWPRLAVAPTFLAPLLLAADVVRSLSVVLEPVAPDRARRSVEAAITSDMADEEIRTQRGFRTTARRRRHHEAVLRREQELASGHQEFRFAAFLTVSGADDADLEAACDKVEQAAHQAYLDVQPLWGEQEAGFAFGALPLARGLRAGSPLGGRAG